MLCFSTTVSHLQAAAYFLSTLVSFFIVIPIGVTLRNDFQGSCILYAQVVWDERTIWPWYEPCCDYILYMNLAVTLLYAFWMGIFCLFVTIPTRYPFAGQYFRVVDEDDTNALKQIEEHDRRFKIHGMNPVFMLINAIIFFLVLSNAIVITVGFSRLCEWVVEGVNMPDLTCSQAQNVLPWEEFRIIRGQSIEVQGNNFYNSLAIATIASWILALVWLFQWVLNFSQSLTWCSCEVAEEKRKPDTAVLIAARRSRMATPIGTPGHMTPGGRATPPVGGGGPMRPYTFGPPPRPQMSHPGQQPPPMQLQQGYMPPPRPQYPPPGVRRSREDLVDRPGPGGPRPQYPPQPVRRSREDLVDRPGQPRPQYPPQPMRRSRENLVDQPEHSRPPQQIPMQPMRPQQQYPPQAVRRSREDLVDRPPQPRPQYPPQPMRRSREDLVDRPGPGRPQYPPQPMRRSREDLVDRPPPRPRQEYTTPPARNQPEHARR